MNRSAKKLVGLALAATMLLSLVGCGGTEKEADTTAVAATEPEYTLVEPGKLTIGSDLDYPPFEMLNADGKPEGFDVELMAAVCEELGLELNYLGPQAFDSLLPQVAAGTKLDIAVSALTITPERAKVVDFTEPYFLSGVDQAIAVLKTSDIKTKDDLAGKRVAVQSGSTPDTWATENLPNSEIIRLNNNTDAFAALMAGKADAVINDEPVSKKFISESFPDAMIVEVIPTAEEYGIGVSKDNAGLTKAINEAIAKLKADGTYDAIYKKWIETE